MASTSTNISKTTGSVTKRKGPSIRRFAQKPAFKEYLQERMRQMQRSDTARRLRCIPITLLQHPVRHQLDQIQEVSSSTTSESPGAPPPSPPPMPMARPNPIVEIIEGSTWNHEQNTISEFITLKDTINDQIMTKMVNDFRINGKRF